MNFRRLFLPILAVSLLSPVAAGAQAPEPAQDTATPVALVELRVKDGSIIYGTIERETPEQVVIRTIAGVVGPL